MIAHIEALGHGISAAIDSNQNWRVNVVKIAGEYGIVDESPWETSELDDSGRFGGIPTLIWGVERVIIVYVLSYNLTDYLPCKGVGTNCALKPARIQSSA